MIRRLDGAFDIRVGVINTDEVRRRSLAVIEELLEGGLVTAGDLTSTTFEEWPSGPAESLARIEREWVALDRDLEIGDVCWLRNTVIGDR